MSTVPSYEAADALARRAIEVITTHVEAKRATKSWSILTVAMEFKAGTLSEIKINDEVTIKAREVPG